MKLDLQLEQKLILTPQLRQAIEILQMSALELKQKIEEELQDNPFLEEESYDEEDEENFKKENRQREDETDDYFYNSSDRGYIRRREPSENFIEGTVSKPTSLKEYLLWQLRLSTADEKLLRAGEMIIGNLNSDGYLTASCDELATVLGMSKEDVNKALLLVQTFEPFGVGARDLKESLLIQLSFLEPRCKVAEQIIRDYYELFVKRKISAIQKSLNVSRELVDEALNVISRLNPRPGLAYDNDDIVYVIPDVIVKKVDGKFLVFLNDYFIPKLNINTSYDFAFKDQSIDEKDRKYMEDKCLSALWLMRNIEHRRMTILKVVNQILEFQSLFFESGPKYLKPLTLKDIASKIKMHESTVSRVTYRKYMQTPWGIFEMKYFFSSKVKGESGESFSSRSVKEIIKDLVEHEKEAFSDAQIVKKLKDMGIKISRRTVTKYRKNLTILPSYMRKTIKKSKEMP